jgi:Ca2+-binding EF-hand superfamily protein
MHFIPEKEWDKLPCVGMSQKEISTENQSCCVCIYEGRKKCSLATTYGEQKMKKVTLTALAVSIAVSGMGFSSAASAKPRGGQQGPKMPSFEQLDTNGDGVITQAEIDAIGEVKFAESDTNGDGFLNAGELKAQMQARGEARREGRGDGEHKGANAGEVDTELKQSQMAERLDLSVKHMIERADENGDGKLSFDEARPPRSGKMFEHVDADENGQITLEEWEAAKAKRGNRNN